MFSNTEPADLIEHHRKSEQNLDQTFFVVVGRLDWEKQGILVVNLNFKGYVDAIRQEVNIAGDDVPSMNIGNTTWFENLCYADQPLFPRNKFAVYVQERHDEVVASTRSSRNKLQELNSLIHEGLDGRKSGSDQKGGICV